MTDISSTRRANDEAADGDSSRDRPRRHSYLFAEGNLDFRPVDIADPVPLGSQLLSEAGVRRTEEYSLFAILANGDFESVRLDEPFDLRGRGTERFISFKTDRSFKFTLDGRHIEWGAATIAGEILRQLAEAGETTDLFLDERGGTDRLISDDDVIDLSHASVERFITRPREVSFTITIIYNGLPKKLEVKGSDGVAATRDRAAALFGASGDLLLQNEAGAELPAGSTLAAAGVVPKSRLLLRQRVVRGG